MRISSTRMAALLSTCSAVLATTACFTPAQTPQAWRDEMRAHRMGRVETWTLSDDSASVSERVQSRFLSCFDVGTETCSGTTLNNHCGRMIYKPRAIEDAPARRTLTLQMKTNAAGPSGRAPLDGMYQVVVDIEAADVGSRVTFYGTQQATHDKVLSAIRGWSEGAGHGIPCPELVLQLREGELTTAHGISAGSAF